MVANKKGQGLVEYLILVALIAVASLGVVRVLNQTINSQFVDIIYALQGSTKKARSETPHDSLYKKKDLSDFMNGAAAKNEDK